MTTLFQNYKHESIEFIKAADNYLVDKEGNFYLDFSSGIGVTNLGFHKQVKQAVSEQLEAIWHSPNLYQNSLQEQVADLLIGDEDYLAFFCNSGAESNEAAIKLARKFSGKSDIITFKQSFHGRTFGAMSATGQEKIQLSFGPLVAGFHYAIYNDLESVKQLVTENTAAVMFALVHGEGGVLPAEKDLVAELAHYCKEQGLLLIVDEVQTGIGRTGSLFAYQQYGISPDIVTLAKGLANGLPVGAMLGKSALGTAFTYGSHGTTFGGNKLVLSSSKAVLEILTEDFLAKVRVNASYLQDQLTKQLGNLPTVVAIRGLGLILGIQVTGDLGTIVTQARKNGLIVLTAGSDVIRLLPPLTITEEEIEKAVSILAECLS